MILAAIGVALIERQFFKAAAWAIAAALLSASGVIHAYELTPGGITSRFGLMAAPEFFVGYVLLAVLFFTVALFARKS
jgi:AGZA family xanthine/uracil permease-like MFS transporter